MKGRLKKAMSHLGCDIIIPVWNQLAFTQDCVDSIFRNTNIGYRMILVDNGSDEKTRNYLESLKGAGGGNVLLSRNDRNMGFIKAVNQAIRLSDAPYICLLNNDTIVTKGWLGEMRNVATISGEIGLVNPSSNNLGQKPARGEPIYLYAEKVRKAPEKFMEIGAAIGFCMLIKRAVIDRIGVFDEVYGMGNFEDIDFSRRAVKEGYLCVRACQAYVYQRKNLSLRKPKNSDIDFRRNREIFEFRWGRPRRILYVLDTISDNVMKKINVESLKLARGGNWVQFVSKEDVAAPRHSNIDLTRLSKKWFYLKVLFMIWKKKKRFDDIFVTNERFFDVLKALRPIHKAEVKYC